MAKIYGATKLDPVNAPIGIVSDGTAVILPQGFTIPSGKDASVGRNLTVGGSLTVTGTITLSGAVNTISNTTNLSVLNVSSAATFSSTVAITGSINSSVVPDSNARDFGSSSVRWGTGYFSTLNATTVTAGSISSSGAVTANSLIVSGSVSFPSSISLSGTTNLSNLSVSGAATFSSNISITGSINTSVLPSANNTYNIGSLASSWGTGYFSALNISSTLSVPNITASTAITSKSLTFSDSSYAYNAQNTALTFFGQGTFTGNLTGCSSSLSASFSYIRIGSMVVFSSNVALEGTSNATTMTLTGLPLWLRPTASVTLPHIVKDNGVLTVGRVIIGTDGTMTFSKDANGTAFTSSGTKGIPALSGCYTIQ